MVTTAPREWLYRASPSKEDLASTRAIVEEFGFIHRTAYTDSDKPQRIALVGSVGVGDIIHFYFVSQAGGASFGAFRVVAPADHPRPDLFAAAVPDAPGLHVVAAGELFDRLAECDGYDLDPKLGVYCGWPVRRDDWPSPPYHRGMFPGQNSLARPS